MRRSKIRRSYCPHERLLRYKRSENLVGLVVAVTGRASPGKTALAREIAKALRCTILEHHRFVSCIPGGDGSASDEDPAYQILWKLTDTHLDDRNHHIVVDYPLSRRVQLDRLLGVVNSHDAVLILIDCGLGLGGEVPQDNREGEAALTQDLKRSLMMEEELADNGFYDYDVGEIDVPKLAVEIASGAELDEQVESVKKLILTSLDEKFMILEGDRGMMSRYGAMSFGCSRCALDAVRRRFDSFPKSFKHELHHEEFQLFYHGDTMRKGSTFSYVCRACHHQGQNLCYSWRKLYFHPECVLPLQVTHKCHWHSLKLTLLPPKRETDEYYCEVCTEERDADSWIYYCRGCEYEAHVPCVVPQLPGRQQKSS